MLNTIMRLLKINVTYLMYWQDEYFFQMELLATRLCISYQLVVKLLTSRQQVPSSQIVTHTFNQVSFWIVQQLATP